MSLPEQHVITIDTIYYGMVVYNKDATLVMTTTCRDIKFHDIYDITWPALCRDIENS